MKNLIKTLIILALTSFSLPTIAQNNVKIDSLIQILETMPEDTNKVNLLYEISEVLYNYDNNQLKEYANKGITLSKKIDYKYGISKGYYFFGLYYHSNQRFTEAINELNKGIVIAKKHLHGDEIASFYTLLGDVYCDNSNYKESYKIYLKALSIYEKNKKNKGIAVINLRLGIVLSYLKKYESSLAYYDKVLQYTLEINDNVKKGNVLNNIGIVYQKQKKHNKALKVFLKVIKLFEKNEAYQIDYANTYLNIGNTYISLEKYNEALEYLKKALKITKNLKNKGYTAILLDLMAEVNLYMNEYDKAISLAHKSIKLAKEIEAPEILGNPYQTLSDVYISIFNKDSARYYYDKRQEIKDSIYSKENREMITELQTKYETEKKEQKIIILTKEKELQKAESKNKTYFIIVLALIILLALIVFYIFTKQQKQKNIQKIAEARIKGMEEEQNRMSRELHDGIGSKLGAFRTKLLLLKNKTITENELNELVDENTQINKEVRYLSHNLTSPELTGENFDTVLNDIAFKTSHSGNLKVDYSSSIEKKWNKISVTKQTEIYRISQEILHNIVKHSKATQAFIQLMQHDTSLNISAEDNGIGFNTETVKKGIGLKNIYQRVKLLGGTVDINSQINKGTIINIEIPF